MLVNNAGLNIVEREWKRISPDGIDALLQGNLNSAFYCARAVLPQMRAQGGGQLIHTASMAGRNVSPLSGPGYTAAKHAVVAMSHTINMEDCVNGIRSTALLPGEVNTPILKNRPNPLSAEDLAKMLQPEHCGDLIRYLACLPAERHHQRSLDHPHLEPRLHRRPGPQAVGLLPSPTGHAVCGSHRRHCEERSDEAIQPRA